MLQELRSEREQIEEAIVTLERLAGRAARNKHSGRSSQRVRQHFHGMPTNLNWISKRCAVPCLLGGASLATFDSAVVPGPVWDGDRALGTALAPPRAWAEAFNRVPSWLSIAVPGEETAGRQE